MNISIKSLNKSNIIKNIANIVPTVKLSSKLYASNLKGNNQIVNMIDIKPNTVISNIY